MAFTFVRNMMSGMSPVAVAKDIEKFEVDTDMEIGYVAKFDTSQPAKLIAPDVDDDQCAVVTLEAGKEADDDKVRVHWIVPGHVYKAKVTKSDGDDLGPGSGGTDMDSDITTGARVRLNANFTGVDGEQAPDDEFPLTVIKVEYDNDKREDTMAWVVFNCCAVNSTQTNT